MTDDIVARLRSDTSITTLIYSKKHGLPNPLYVHGISPICSEAADEIERLRARVTELEEKLNDAYAFIDRHESGLRALIDKVIAWEAAHN